MKSIEYDDRNRTALSLLVADDHPDMRTMLKFLMDSWGYDADIVANGLEAVQQVQTRMYDLCLMDQNMPVMNGFTAIEKIRKKAPYFPILMLSSDEPLKQPYLAEKGIDEWIEKGCDSNFLHQRIAEWGNVRTIAAVKRGNRFVLRKEMPMNPEHAKEILALKQKGFVKVKFSAHGEDLILHKNATNKISHDFNVKDQLISVFINHDQEQPTRCELYREHCHITQTYLSEDDYSAETADEVAEMAHYQFRALKAEDN